MLRVVVNASVFKWRSVTHSVSHGLEGWKGGCQDKRKQNCSFRLISPYLSFIFGIRNGLFICQLFFLKNNSLYDLSLNFFHPFLYFCSQSTKKKDHTMYFHIHSTFSYNVCHIQTLQSNCLWFCRRINAIWHLIELHQLFYYILSLVSKLFYTINFNTIYSQFRPEPGTAQDLQIYPLLMWIWCF